MKKIVEFIKKFGAWIVVTGIIIWRVIRGANSSNSNVDALTRRRDESRDDVDRSLRRAIKLNRDATKQLGKARGTIERLRELDQSDSEALKRARRAIDIIRAELEIRAEVDERVRAELTE